MLEISETAKDLVGTGPVNGRLDHYISVGRAAEVDLCAMQREQRTLQQAVMLVIALGRSLDKVTPSMLDLHSLLPVE